MDPRHISYDQLDSTNRVAKELVAQGQPAGTVVCAKLQTAGRGQYGRSFSSPLGGLYFSLILEPDLPSEDLPLITLATGLACRTVLEQTFSLNPSIKWPNDIYLDGRKVAGILCELVWLPRSGGLSSAVIIGVGLNVNSQVNDFAPEIQPIVTTLRDHLHTVIDLSPLLTNLIQAITVHVDRISHDREALLARWQEADYLLHKRVVHTREGQVVHGVGLGITAQGLYRIRDDRGLEHTVIGGQLRSQG